MHVDNIEAAARQFGHGKPVITSLGNGLIHHTYKVEFSGDGLSRPIVLQCINRHTFKHPENIISNYRLVYESVASNNGLHLAPWYLPWKGNGFGWIPNNFFESNRLYNRVVYSNHSQYSG
ncbi:hypothetical protein [Paraflavitalea speifideaquila]|uniref:hypothetical protein n=1 Tax=Paraflavitalea speifideaquila TaxID=3076558 RepID=UPI0028E1AC3A|nr:hypothetical protein [Paraflavitalea speifideiaquila]